MEIVRFPTPRQIPPKKNNDKLMAMIRSLVLKTVFFLSLFLPIVSVQAQETQETASPLDLRTTMGTVLIAGLVGGVLGLSTLSFYDKPQDHIKNIFFGAGGMMLIAVVVSTADVADKGIPKTGFFEKRFENGTELYALPLFDPESKSAALSISMNF